MTAPVLGTPVEGTATGLTPNLASSVSISGSGRGLIVILGIYNSTGNNTPSSVVYDTTGTPINLTSHVNLSDYGGANDTSLQVWVTSSEPREDTNKTVTATYPVGVNGWMVAIPVTGLDWSSSPWGAAQTSGDTSRESTNTSAVTASADHIVIDALTIYNKTVTLGGSQASLANGVTSSQRLSASSKAGDTSVTMSQSWVGATADWAHAVFAVAGPSSGGGSSWRAAFAVQTNQSIG